MELNNEIIGGSVLGVGVGAGSVYAIRKWADPKYNVEQLGKYGKPSVLAGALIGLPALAFGVAGLYEKGPVADKELLASSLASAGLALSVGGVLGVTHPVEVAPSNVSRVTLSRSTTPNARINPRTDSVVTGYKPGEVQFM